jgi:hypothetical protein
MNLSLVYKLEITIVRADGFPKEWISKQKKNSLE